MKKVFILGTFTLSILVAFAIGVAMGNALSSKSAAENPDSNPQVSHEQCILNAHELSNARNMVIYKFVEERNTDKVKEILLDSIADYYYRLTDLDTLSPEQDETLRRIEAAKRGHIEFRQAIDGRAPAN